MIFPSESLIQFRRKLMARVASGEITQHDAFEQALRRDPDDGMPLTFLALEAEDAGDLAEAERYARKLIENRPSGHDGYLLLSRILGKTRPEPLLARGYLALAVAKMQFDDDAIEGLEDSATAPTSPLSHALKNVPKDLVPALLSQVLEKEQSKEPIEVEDELRPHRLVHELREHRDDVLDSTLVDGILEHAAACEPLLLGILKEFGSDLLTDDDYRMVERALVLLGEIGNPAILPSITEFLALDEEDLSGPADWAFRRISFQHPVEVLDQIRAMVPTAGAPERVVLGEQIAMMPKVPGRSAVLSDLVQNVERFPKAERDAVIFSAIAGFYLVEGGKSFQAAALERKYAGTFSGEARADLRTLHRETAFLEPGDASPDEYSVYDICCKEPDFDDDNDDDDADVGTVVNHDPKPGRNEPCWCGSGKKYKKCHLDEDQRS